MSRRRGLSPQEKKYISHVKGQVVTGMIALYGAVQTGRISVQDAYSYFDNMIYRATDSIRQILGLPTLKNNNIVQAIHNMLINTIRTKVDQNAQKIIDYFNAGMQRAMGDAAVRINYY